MSRLFIPSLKTWGFQVAPKPGETWGFHVAPKIWGFRPAQTFRGFQVVPRRPSPGKLGVSMSRHDRNRRRPSLLGLGVSMSCPGAQAWETWGFHVPPLMEPRVSALYGTMETRGFQQFPKAGNSRFP